MNNQFGGGQYGGTGYSGGSRGQSNNNRGNPNANFNRMNQEPTSGAMFAPQGVTVDDQGRGSDGKNYVKHYNNWIYFPSCRYDVLDNHFASGYCPRTGIQHNPSITRKNTMGGNQKAAHKFILPNAVG